MEQRPLDLEPEWKIKHYVQELVQTLTILYEFAHCRSAYSSNKPLYLFQPGDWVLLKTWYTQWCEQQLDKQRTGPRDVQLMIHSALKLAGIKLWTHHTQIKQVPPEENSNPTAMVDAAKESWTCTPEGDLKILFWKTRAGTNAKWQYSFTSFICSQI